MLVALVILGIFGQAVTFWRITTMAFTLNDIENAVTAQNTVIDSVAVLLNQLTEELATANEAGDQDSVSRIIGEIQANTARLTNAVTANTPGGVQVTTPVQNPVQGSGVVTNPDGSVSPAATQTQVAPTPADVSTTPVETAPVTNPDDTETANADTAAIGTPPASGTTTAPVSTPANPDPAPEATPGGKGNFSNL